MNIGSLTAQIGANTAGFDAAMARVKSKMLGSVSTLKSVGASSLQAGSMLSMGFTAPLALAGFEALRMAGQYDATMKQVGVATNATGGQMKALSAKAIQLGADIHLPGTSASDAAGAMLELGKAGMNAKQILASSHGVLVAAAAAQISNADAANITVNALTAFGLKAAQAGQVANTLAGGANASTTDMQGMALALGQVGQSAHAAHLSLGQTVAAIAEMANAGIPAASAGAALKVMLMRLTPQGKAAQAAMRSLGVSTYDAQGKMRPFTAIVDQFRKGMAGMTEGQRNAALQTIFGSRAINAARIIFGQGSGALDKLTTAVTKQGQAARMAAAQNSGIKGAMDGLVSTVSTMAVMLGNFLAPAFEQAVRWGQQFLAWCQSLSGPVKAAIAGFAGALAIVGPALLAVGAAILVVTSPLILLTLAIAGAVAAFVYFYKTNSQFKAFADNLRTSLASKIPAAIALFKSAFQTAKAVVLDVVSFIQAHWQQGMQIVTSAVSAVVGFMRSAWPVISSVARTAWSAIKQAWDADGKSTFDLVKTTVLALIATFKAAWPAISAVVKVAWSVIHPVLVLLETAIRGVEVILRALVKVFQWMVGPITASVKLVAKAVSWITWPVRTALGIVNAATDGTANHFKMLASAAVTSANQIVAAALKIAAAARSMAAGRGGSTTAAGPLGPPVPPSTKGAPRMAHGAGVGWGPSVTASILSSTGMIANAIAGVVGAAERAAAGPTHNVGIHLGNKFLQGVLEGTQTLPSKLSDTMKKAVSAALDQIKTATDNKRSALESAWSTLADKAMQAFDAKTQAHLDNMQKKATAAADAASAALDKANAGVDATYGADTPAEAALKALQAGHDAAQIQQQIADAQKALADAQAGGDPDAIKQAQQQLNDALYDQQVAALQAQADLERAAADQKASDAKAANQAAADATAAAAAAKEAQDEKNYQSERDLQKEHLQKWLDAQEKALEANPAIWLKHHKDLMKLFKTKFGPDFAAAGANLGNAFMEGVKESMGSVENIVKQLAQLIADYLKLHSPAKTGPLSSLNTWWKGMAPTLLSGLDTGAIDDTLNGLGGSGGALGAGGYAGGGGVTVIHMPVTVTGSVVSENELFEAMRRRLIKHGMRNTSIFSTPGKVTA